MIKEDATLKLFFDINVQHLLHSFLVLMMFKQNDYDKRDYSSNLFFFYGFILDNSNSQNTYETGIRFVGL